MNIEYQCWMVWENMYDDEWYPVPHATGPSPSSAIKGWGDMERYHSQESRGFIKCLKTTISAEVEP
jgi:hypothetical protein